MPTQNDQFDPVTVALEGSNLIEASAGTGKTYSIAIMMLRLIMEKRIPIRKILMVTFTNAAVAELELRVRSFVRQALKVSRGQDIEDRTIHDLVRAQMADGREEEVRDLLTAAQVMLDETSVMTIHSFCQQVLTEYSFETGLVFGADTMSKEAQNQISAEAFREFWRQRITTLRVEVLDRLLDAGLSMDGIYGIVKDGLSGKIPALATPIPAGFLSEGWQDAVVADAKDFMRQSEVMRKGIEEGLEAGKKKYLDQVMKNSFAKKAYGKLLQDEDWAGMTDALVSTNNGYTTTIFQGLKENADRLKAREDAYQLTTKQHINHIARAAFDAVKTTIDAHKSLSGQITFDDMIRLVHEALSNGSARDKLIAYLHATYDAVFIDEFQDTDRAQYHIFETLFGTSHILFYIGDPKQSIYGFRKADIFTYFAARDAVSHIHRMNVNHRSTAAYIGAMNGFFKPARDFDTFHFTGEQHSIDYLPVQSPDPNTRGELLFDGEPVRNTLRISGYGNKPELRALLHGIMQEVLLSGRYAIRKQGAAVAEPVGPNDIGILVRTRHEGIAVKEVLSRMQIPAITIDDSRVFASSEAMELHHVMVAVHDISRSNINRALLTRIGGYDMQRLLVTDEDDILLRFRKYQDLWRDEGVYVMLRCFLSDHGIDRMFTGRDISNPERTVSNILQLVEVIHKVADRKKYGPLELIQWLKKGIDGDTREGDEYQQRIESDEQAVKIVTIHKSKGLEYKIVIAPHLDFVKNKNVRTISYRDPVDSEYYVINEDLLSPEDDRLAWAQRQLEQENRRLLYVAITRARYLCHITGGDSGQHKNSTLRKFRDALKAAGPLPGVDLDWQVSAAGAAAPPAAAPVPVRTYAVAENFGLLQPAWRKASYTALSLKHEPAPLPAPTDEALSAYDRFIFRDIRRGAHTGNLLHHVFEYIDFSDETYWPSVIDRSIRRLTTPKDDSFRTQLAAMVSEVTRARIIPGSDFTLSMLTRDRRLTELEFDYPLSLFNTRDILSLSTEDTPFHLEAGRELEGIMNGKVDLLFEHGGKYYILDWKSNYLGDRLTQYDAGSVAAAMGANNYHLQYHIYTVAVCRYLKTRIPDFDYERDFGGVIYLFVRGVRAEGDTGIFFRRPDPAVVGALEAMAPKATYF